MQSIKHQQDLFSAMKHGATIITPNNRLSNQLLNDCFQQTESGINAWDNIHCLPYQAFLHDLFKKVRHSYAQIKHPIVLNSQQQRYLWRQILTQSSSSCNDGLLSAVQDAWTRCRHWQISIDHPAFSHTPQTRLFQQWQQQFQSQLHTLGAITEEQLIDHLLNYPDLFESNSSCIWICFDDYTPQQRRLSQAMDDAGCQQYQYDLREQSPKTYHYPAKDPEDEYLQMVEWVKLRLASGDQRIALVIPDLKAQSQRVQRLLQRHISPDQFNISLGQPLIDYPLVAHALHWLGLGTQSITNHQARLLLHSPYLAGSKTEFNARSELLQNTKLLQETNITLSTYIQAINHSAPQLAGRLNNLSEDPDMASPHIWINRFKHRLNALGFPGEYPLHSITYQCFQRFIALLDELLPLSIITPLMSQKDALDALHDLAKSTIFQPQKAMTPIQILGLLEASGCQFDSIWVSGLTDQCLPQKTNLSAFIPIDLQRELQMPHAVTERELQFATQLIQRLKNGCNQIIFSYPRLTGDSPNLPSPLICHLPELILNNIPLAKSPSCLIERTEDYLLPIKLTEPIRGGSALLANQAKCPFRAFATHRLHAKPALKITDGPDASERGQIIHKILDLLWQRIGSQHQLLLFSSNELHQHIEESILNALAPLTKERGHSFSPLIQEVELARLHRLINASLDWEKKRPSFVVEALEQSFSIELAGIDFHLRVDRLDKIASDKKWVIDYKSSLPINKPWNEERPEAPQLLLYALLDHDINGLLFVQLKTGRITCSGLTEEKVPIQGISTLKKDESWSELQQQWHEQLTQLATEFKNGHCAPTPNRPTTCQQCDFPNLCRIGR